MIGTRFPPVPPEQPPDEPSSRFKTALQRAKTFASTRRIPLLILANILVTFLVVFAYNASQPVPPTVTQSDIDAAVNRTLASATPAPSPASIAYSIIQPSLVLVHAQYSGAEDKDSIGSGIILDTSGNILSALHVVKNATRIEVFFATGLSSDAEILASSEENDIVVLKPNIVPDDVVPAVLAGTPQVGEEVFAVGNPFGITNSISAGVVSGVGRQFTSQQSGRELKDLIQFDAAVNPGNSGGPLINRNGEVVGIVTTLLNPTGQEVFIGIGFAVPIMTASSVGGEVPY